MSKKISLTRNQFAFVDDIDFEWLNRWKWQAMFNWNKTGFYARRRAGGKTIYMHRLIMNCPPDKDIDHKNHNILDNRRCNLRICKNKENQANRQVHTKKTSQYKGVYVRWNKRKKKWVSMIKHNYKNLYLGSYDSEVKAAKAYDKTAIELFGEFACLNFAKAACYERTELC